MEPSISSEPNKGQVPELVARLKLPSIVAGILAILSPLLQLVESLRKLPAPLIVVWFSVLVGVSCVLIWALATALREAVCTERPYPRYPFRWAVWTMLCAVFAVAVSGCIYKYTIYRKMELKEPMVQPTWKAPDPAKSTSLWDLFAASNPELLRAASPKAGAHLVFVMGGAGEGKGFMVEHLSALNPKAIVLSLCQRNGGDCRDTNGIAYVRRPELRYGPNGDHYFNQMSFIAGFKDEEFFKAFDTAPLVLIDDLDEIHPDSVPGLLDKLAEYVSKPNASTQILVFGRPEAFAAFYRATNATNRDRLSPPVELFPPAYGTQHEFELLAMDWAEYARRKKGLHINNPQEIGQRLYQYAQRWSWVFESVHELYLGNFLCESLRQHPTWTEKELKKHVVDEVFDRANRTHNRPAFNHALYRDLILDIAAGSADKTDPQTGFFEVQNWSIRVPWKVGATDDILVERVLGLSGVAKLSPANYENESWKFEPRWLQEYFLQEYNEHQLPPWWVAAQLYWIVLLITPVVTLLVGSRTRRRLISGNSRP